MVACPSRAQPVCCCPTCITAVQAPMIDNPEYEHIPDVYKLPPLKFVGFELWQARQLLMCCADVSGLTLLV